MNSSPKGSVVQKNISMVWYHRGVETVLWSLTWWRHQMETFSVLLALCAGNSPVPGEFPPHKGQWRGALMFSFICARLNGWVSNDETGDLRRYRAQYDVTVMYNAFVVQCDVFHCNTKSTEICAVSHLRNNRPLDQQIVYILRSISEMTITCL